MRPYAVLIVALGIGLPTSVGCNQNPYVQSQNPALAQQQSALDQRNRELVGRASALDHDNADLQSRLAQMQQQNRLLDDQLAAMREQLGSMTKQLTLANDARRQTERQAESLAESTRRRGGAMITANSSLRRNLPAINIPGAEVRNDGDVVRIELSASRLFAPGAATLQSGAGVLLDAVAAEVSRTYPDQMIGIEGHTDAEGQRGAGATASQQLSLNRAMAVYQHVAGRGQLQPAQIFVAGHGGNQPVVSNATPAGRERNNRVELVIYPESARGK